MTWLLFLAILTHLSALGIGLWVVHRFQRIWSTASRFSLPDLDYFLISMSISANILLVGILISELFSGEYMSTDASQLLVSKAMIIYHIVCGLSLSGWHLILVKRYSTEPR